MVIVEELAQYHRGQRTVARERNRDGQQEMDQRAHSNGKRSGKGKDELCLFAFHVDKGERSCRLFLWFCLDMPREIETVVTASLH